MVSDQHDFQRQKLSQIKRYIWILDILTNCVVKIALYLTFWHNIRTFDFKSQISRFIQNYGDRVSEKKTETLRNNCFTINVKMQRNIFSESRQATKKRKNNQQRHDSRERQRADNATATHGWASQRKQIDREHNLNINKRESCTGMPSDKETSEENYNQLRASTDKPPITAPVCYSVNQLEVIQTLGSQTFADANEAQEFLQKIASLKKKPEARRICRTSEGIVQMH